MYFFFLMWRFQGLIVCESVFFPIFGNLYKPADYYERKQAHGFYYCC